jgi:hypothetical protein
MVTLEKNYSGYVLFLGGLTFEMAVRVTWQLNFTLKNYGSSSSFTQWIFHG